MAVILGAGNKAQAKSYINTLKKISSDGGATGAVIPDRRQPVASSVPTTQSTSIPAQIIGGDAVTGFIVDLYADGINKGSTGKGIVFLLAGNMQQSPNVTVGMWVFVQSTVVELYGG